MPLKIIRNDITKLKVDAVVNPTNSIMKPDGGVDLAIHVAAGKKLAEKCCRLGACKTGEAKLTQGYDLNAKYIIHTVGPVWNGGADDEEKLLSLCYKSCLSLAKNKKISTIAFPLISSGVYGFPRDKALRIAVNEITVFLLENDITVYIVLYDRETFDIGSKLFSDIKEYIDDTYVKKFEIPRARRIFSNNDISCTSMPAPSMEYKTDPSFAAPSAKNLHKLLENLDESFSQMLLRMIDEKGMTDVECYKKANIDRKLFSKIRSDKNYRPKKVTAIAFAISLELDLYQTKSLLEKAGYALSHSNKFDIIIEYFIINKNYNIFEINEALFAFDQVLLGA